MNMLHCSDKIWFAARTKRNQEKIIKTKLEQIGVEHFAPFRIETRKRKDRYVKIFVPILPNIVFIFTDYQTSLSIINDYGVKISYIKAIHGKGPLIVPKKQMDDFRFIYENDIQYILSDDFDKGNRVRVIQGCLAGLEGELIYHRGNSGQMVIRLNGIASFKVTVQVNCLERIPNI